MLSAQIFFSGKVQGVGFRFTTCHIATSLKLKGWVRNLTDGRVEALVVGDKDSIEILCRQLKDHFGEFLQDSVIIFKENTILYQDFKVIH